jgi:hypothetical protein
MARPRKLSPEKEKELGDQIEKLAAIHCTWREVAAVVGHKEDYLQYNFSELYAKGKERGKMSLRRKMWETAMGGSHTMQIWLSKQYLDMTDKQDIKQQSSVNIDLEGFKFVEPKE